MKLTVRLAIMSVSLALVAAGGASYLALRNIRDEMTLDARVHGEEVARSAAHRMVVPALLEDEVALTRELEQFGLHEGVVAARVTFVSGGPPVSLAPRAGTAAFTVSVPVVPPPREGTREPPSAPARVGTLEASFSLDGVNGSMARIQRTVALGTLAIFAVAALVGFAVASWITRRVRALAAATERVAGGDLESEVTVAGADEIAALARSFNEMVRAVARSTVELKGAERELARKERLASLGQFTAMIAHEIRNPLGIILSSAQIARNEERPQPQRRQALGFILDEVRRLNRILDDFLRFARPREPMRGPVALDVLAQGALKRFEAPDGVTASTETADPDAATEGRPTPTAEVDGDQMAQALLNLTLNAVQAGAKNVRLRYGRLEHAARTDSGNNNSGQVFLEVVDDGPGFPQSVLAKAGEPFVSTRPEGSGLGLAVVFQIVRAHGGDVQIGAVEPHGARVRLLLPAHGDRAETRSPK